MSLHEVFLELPGSGCIVRGSAIIAIKAQPVPKPGLLKAPRDGSWL